MFNEAKAQEMINFIRLVKRKKNFTNIWLYQDATIYLPRKHEKYLEFTKD